MGNKNSAQSYNCVSKAITKPLTFRWRIEQFPFRLLEIDDIFESTEFEVGDGMPMTVILERIKAENGDEDLAVYLCKVSDKKAVKLEFSITLVNSQPGESIIGRVEEPQLFEEAGQSWGKVFFPYSVFIDKNEGFLSSDNSLTVVVEGVAFIDEKRGEIDLLPLDLDLTNVSSDDFGKMFNDGTLSDFLVIAKDAEGVGKEFKVHKVILATRSEFFAAMFSQPGVKESREGVMEVEDVDSGAMESLLRFLYTGKIPPKSELSEGDEGTNENKELELLIAADKYRVLGLKNHLERLLSAKLSIENVCEILVIAERHSAPILSDRCKKFIRSNSAEIGKTDGWRQLFIPENAELVAELITQ